LGLAVYVQDYRWCRCEAGKWVCNNVSHSSNRLLFGVDNEKQPTAWVFSPGK
jgi:hypothetical protein